MDIFGQKTSVLIIIFNQEALTPLKRIIPTCNQDEEEERNLSAFEKVLLECGQDRPANLMEFLKARYMTSLSINLIKCFP